MGMGLPPSAAPLGLPALFPPLDILLPQWSQHNGCFHTLRDKGRRLRHDTALPSRGRHLGVFKNKWKREMRTINTAIEKTSSTNPLRPLSMPGATWASVAAEGVCVGLFFFWLFSFFFFGFFPPRKLLACFAIQVRLQLMPKKPQPHPAQSTTNKRE